MAVDKEYLDAKFDGLEKLMAAQEKNLTGYIGGVNASVKEVRKELQDHKESSDAHGAGALNRGGGAIISWLGLAVAVIAAIVATLHK